MSISEGCYSNDLIQQVSWAYRLHQLEDALRECYRTDCNLEDTSKYDNCDGIPEYKGGFMEWWEDIRSKREDFLAKKRSGVLREGLDDLFYEKSTSDYSQLEALIMSGDDKAFITGLIERQKAVENELDTLRARSLAIVSIEGGPSKESMDTIYQHVQSEMSPENSIDPDPDEMDEVVSNVIEKRHNFVVDDIIQMVLLEEELKQLQSKINSFEARDPSRTNFTENVTEDDHLVANIRIDSNAGGTKDVISALDINPTDEDLQLIMDLISTQNVEARKLEEDLLTKKSINSKKLNERIAERKKARMQELLRQNSLMNELDATNVVDAEFFEEETSEHRMLEYEMASEMKEFYKKSLVAIRRRGEEEADRLSGELAVQKESRKKSLNARLEERKKAILEKGETEGIDVSSEIEAIEGEALESVMAIEEENLALTREKREKLIKVIRSQHEAEAMRLEDELNFQRENQKRDLRRKLDMKVSKRIKEIEATARQNGDEISTLEALALAEEEVSDELSAGWDSIDRNFDDAMDKEKENLMQSLKTIYQNETSKLNIILESSQNSQRQRLQERLRSRKDKIESFKEGQHVDDNAALSFDGQMDNADAGKSDVVDAFEAQLLNVKNTHAQENEKFMNSLGAQKSLQSKSLRSRLEKKERLRREKDMATHSKSLSKESFLQSLKDRHQRSISRLEEFIEQQRLSEMNKLTMDKACSRRERARSLMLYSKVKEAFMSGYKKKCLYELKLAKESISGIDACPGAEYFELKSFKDAAVSNAVEQLLKKYSRDVAGQIALQLAERSDLLRKLNDDSATGSRIIDAESKHDDQCFEKILRSVEASTATIAAVFVDDSLLMDEGKSVEDRIIEDEEDEDNYLSELDGSHKKISMKFGEDLIAWFQNTLEVIKMYSDASSTLSLHLSDVHVAIQAGVDVNKVIEASGDLRFNILKPSIPLILKSFLNAFRILPTYLCDDERRRILGKDLTQTFGIIDSNEDFTQVFNNVVINRENAEGSATSSPVKYALPNELRNKTKIESVEKHEKNIDTCIDLYKKALDKFLHDPFVGTEKLKLQKAVVKKLLRQRSSDPSSMRRQLSKRKSSGLGAYGKKQRRDEIMLDNLKARVNRRKRELASELSEADVTRYNDALDDVRKFVLEKKEDLVDVDVDGLMRVVEMIVSGETIKGVDDYILAQKEVEQAEGRRQAQRMIKQAQADEERLDIALKLEKAKRQQMLQKRLLTKKKK